VKGSKRLRFKLGLLVLVAFVLIILFLPKRGALFVSGSPEEIVEYIILKNTSDGLQKVQLDVKDGQNILSALNETLLQYRGPYRWINLKNGEATYYLLFFNSVKQELVSLTLDESGYAYTSASRYAILDGKANLLAAIKDVCP
jgi:hypothetical protein